MIYVFDLDETLCTWNGSTDYHKATPIKERIDKVNKLYDEGNTIIIDTARGSITGRDHRKYVMFQLKRWGVKYHDLHCGRKPFGHFYIDDKAISDKDFFK